MGMTELIEGAKFNHGRTLTSSSTNGAAWSIWGFPDLKKKKKKLALCDKIEMLISWRKAATFSLL